MRKKVCEIRDRDELEKILERCRIGRLATLGEDGYPYITPVNYVWLNGSVYFHTAHEGEKIENMKRDNRVCFEVDIPLSYLGLDYNRQGPTCHVHQFYHCIIIRGRAEILEDLPEKVQALNALVATHEGQRAFTPVDGDTKGVGLCTVVGVRVESISGKCDIGQKKSIDEKRRVAEYLSRRGMPGDREAAALILEMCNG